MANTLQNIGFSSDELLNSNEENKELLLQINANVEVGNDHFTNAQRDFTDAESLPIRVLTSSDDPIVLALNTINTTILSMKEEIIVMKNILLGAKTGQDPLYIYDAGVPPITPVETLKVYLQGAWRGSEMGTELLDASLIPLTDPYFGVFTVTEIPDDTVDWVLLEYWTDVPGVGTLVANDLGFILKNGNIVSSGMYSSPIGGEVVAPNINGTYYLRVKHRTHLFISSSTPLQIVAGQPVIYDFTTSQTKAWQSSSYSTNNPAMKEISAGIFGMWGGNATPGTANSQANIIRADGVVQINDYAAIQATLNGNSSVGPIYSKSDVTMNGIVDSSDLQLITDNLASLTGVIQIFAHYA